MRAGVVGHVELVEFAVVERLPRPGEILHARERFVEAAGGGAVAAVWMARLLGGASFFTALGDDAAGEQAAARLRELGVDLHAAVHARPQRRAFTFLDDAAERTITIMGERLVPLGADPLPWEAIGALDAVYVTGGDAAALRAARAARVVVATSRAMPALGESGIAVDALVLSADDPAERAAEAALSTPPALVVRTRGAEGGEWVAHEGRTGTWASTEPPGDRVDAYGCGDTFAAGLTMALGAGLEPAAALDYAARCGAMVLTGCGPYGAKPSAGPPA